MGLRGTLNCQFLGNFPAPVITYNILMKNIKLEFTDDHTYVQKILKIELVNIETEANHEIFFHLQLKIHQTISRPQISVKGTNSIPYSPL